MLRLRNTRTKFFVLFLIVIISFLFNRGFRNIYRNVNLKNSSNQIINPDPAHYAKVSLDWFGTYEGVVPNTGGMEVRTLVTLRKDYKFILVREYLGKDRKKSKIKGNFEWDATGNVVVLKEAEPPNMFFVSENYLIQLDIEGKRIKGDLADKYILKKQ